MSMKTFITNKYTYIYQNIVLLYERSVDTKIKRKHLCYKKHVTEIAARKFHVYFLCKRIGITVTLNAYIIYKWLRVFF